MKLINNNLYAAKWKHLPDADSAINSQAEKLFNSISHSTIFSSPAWQGIAKDFIVENRNIYELNIYSDSELCGWLLVSVGREIFHKVSATSVRFVGYPFNDRMSLLLDPGMKALTSFAINALCDAPFLWDVTILNELYDLDEKERLCESLNNGEILQTQWLPAAISPLLNLNFKSNQALLNSYSKTLKTRLRRAEKKINMAGNIDFKRIQPNADEVDSYINIFKTIENKSWKGKQNVGIFSTAYREKFFRAIAKSFAKRNWLDISLLYLNGQAISYRFGFSYRHTYFDYNLAFDDAFSKLSPGRILLDKIITSSFEAGQKNVDSSRSSREDLHILSDWSKDLIEHHDLWIFKKTLKGYILAFIIIWLKKLKRN